MPELHPFLILALGVATVVGLLIGLRAHAFLALIAAALVVSLLAPGGSADKVSRVAEAFGRTAGEQFLTLLTRPSRGQRLRMTTL